MSEDVGWEKPSARGDGVPGSFRLADKGDRALARQRPAAPAASPGRLGRDLTLEQGQAAARLVMLNLLVQLRAACDGDFDRVRRCVRLGGFVNSTPEFNQQTLVMNGASDLLIAILGERGRHARFVVGCSNLPFDLAVEIEGMFEVD